MNRPFPASSRDPARSSAHAPLIWVFDGVFPVCLTDIEDTLRRAIVQLGDIRGIAVGLDISLPALATRVAAGDVIQPAWSRFVTRVRDQYGLPNLIKVRHRREAGPLATLVIVYRS